MPIETRAFLVHRPGPDRETRYVVRFAGEDGFTKWVNWADQRGMVLRPNAPNATNVDPATATVFVMHIDDRSRIQTVSVRLLEYELKEWLKYAQTLHPLYEDWNGVGRPPAAHLRLTSYKERVGIW
jgi:hypothetical protein